MPTTCTRSTWGVCARARMNGLCSAFDVMQTKLASPVNTFVIVHQPQQSQPDGGQHRQDGALVRLTRNKYLNPLQATAQSRRPRPTSSCFAASGCFTLMSAPSNPASSTHSTRASVDTTEASNSTWWLQHVVWRSVVQQGLSKGAGTACEHVDAQLTEANRVQRRLWLPLQAHLCSLLQQRH